MHYSDLIYELDRQNTYNKEEGLPSSEKLFTYYMEMLSDSLFIGNYKIALQGSHIVILNKDGKPCYRTLQFSEALNMAKTLNTR